MIHPYVYIGLPHCQSKDSEKHIIEYVCSTFKVSFESLCEKNKKHKLVVARYTICYLIKLNNPSKTLLHLSSIFGKAITDHTTVMHGLRTIENLLQTKSSPCCKEIEHCISRLKNNLFIYKLKL